MKVKLTLDNKEFGIVIVAYNPQAKDDLKVKISKYTEVCSKIVLVDNKSEVIPDIPNNDCVTLISNSSNYGHAKALNIGCAYLKQEGYTHALLLGQDSIIENESIMRLWNCIRNSQYAMVGPQITSSDKTEKPTFLIRTKQIGRAHV